MVASGLSADPQEYRRRLDEQSDQQIDSWSIELMRDLSVWIGVRRVLAEFRKAAGIDDRMLERVYAAGGGPPATIGHDEAGEMMVPAIALHCLVPGLHSQIEDARPRLTNFLVQNFDQLVYI
ncbi:MAG TPA: hypothetical protein VFW92_06410 [Candidatus Limnocylindrales bacterium]|nr:hypothetical protein [Candidatus Limnocylindrales bacterium]